MKNVILVAMIMASGCATVPYKAQEVNREEFTSKGHAVGDGVMGMNKKKQIIVKQVINAADEYRIQELANYSIQSKLDNELFTLKMCRKDMADTRLGGSGKVVPVPAIDSMRSFTEVREELGLDKSGELVVVRESYFEEMLKSARTYYTTMTKMLAVAEAHREECEDAMAIARRNAGLPSKRIRGGGYFTSGGVFVTNSRNENSLDDAFEIAASNKARSQ